VTLREFRKDFGDRAEPLSTIWEHLLDHGQWITRRALHDPYLRRGVHDIRARMEHLGGSLVFDYRAGDRECYRLTFLGVLLTADGPAIEVLLVRYLEWLRGRYRTNGRLDRVSIEEVAAGLQLTSAETAVLSRVLDVARWPEGAVMEDVFARALESYDPELPIDRAFAE